jgi:hypothetical protein
MVHIRLLRIRQWRWYQGFYSVLKENNFKCLQTKSVSLRHVDVCKFACQSGVSQWVLRNGSYWMTYSHQSCDWLRNYGWKLQITFFTNSTSRTVVSISVDLPRSIWLATNLQQTPTWRKLSPSATDTDFFLTGTQALVIRQDRCLDDNDVYLDVRCLQSPTDLPCFHTSHNEVLAIRMFVTFLFESPLHFKI